MVPDSMTGAVWTYLLILFNLAGLTGNTIVLLTFIFGKSHIRQAKIFPVVLCLTLADSVMVAFVMPTAIMLRLRVPVHEHVHTVFLLISRFVNLAILQLLTMLAANVYFYLATPFTYNSNMHQRRAGLACVLSAFLALLVTAATFDVSHSHVTPPHAVTPGWQWWEQSADVLSACVLPAVLCVLPLVMCCVFGALVLAMMITINRKLLNQVVSIGDRRLTAAQKRQFRAQLCRAVLFVLVKTVLNVAALAPYWLLSTLVGCTMLQQYEQWRPALNTLHELLCINACIDPAITMLTQHNYREALHHVLINALPHCCSKVRHQMSTTVRKYTIDQISTVATPQDQREPTAFELDSDEFNVALHELRVLRQAVLGACMAPLAVATNDRKITDAFLEANGGIGSGGDGDAAGSSSVSRSHSMHASFVARSRTQDTHVDMVMHDTHIQGTTTQLLSSTGL